MRKILFRGKRKDKGEWVEGFYVERDNASWIYPAGNQMISRSLARELRPMHSAKSTQKIMREVFPVDPDTVGQYTGLLDNNGKRIFEGDSVKAVIIRDLGGGTQNREETGIIGYDKIGMIGLIAKYAGTIPVWSDFFQELTLSGCIDDFWFEVIGNIHDNSELMEADHAD